MDGFDDFAAVDALFAGHRGSVIGKLPHGAA
jgi:hypothetical protein